MSSLPKTMSGVVLTGHGGMDKLVYRTDLEVPMPGPGEVLVKVGAAAVNNTDINTRIGWYSKSVKEDTKAGGSDGYEGLNDEDASWSGTPLDFPRIQGADVAGTIVQIGENVDPRRIGDRVLIRPIQGRETSKDGLNCITFGSECDGGFAEYTKCVDEEAFSVSSKLSDAELASFPCAYSTAENMIIRAGLRGGNTVLVAGASGGVGSAAVQLAKLHGAKVIAMCGSAKAERVRKLGADKIVPTGENLVETLGSMSVDVVLDMVAGSYFNQYLDILKRGGKYATVGAIAGPLVELDVRTLYLKDLTFTGSTYQPREAFENVIRYIEEGDLVPLVSKMFALNEIREAQEAFLAKKFVGKLVLVL